jgi:hypothetical protein
VPLGDLTGSLWPRHLGPPRGFALDERGAPPDPNAADRESAENASDGDPEGDDDEQRPAHSDPRHVTDEADRYPAEYARRADRVQAATTLTEGVPADGDDRRGVAA